MILSALNSLGYKVIDNAKYLQWKKPVKPGDVKMDFMIGSIDEHRKYLKSSKPPRVRNKAVKGFHAHITPEAIWVDEKALRIPLKGQRSNGIEYETTICLPHPFTYLVMKLFAFRDRQEDENKKHGSHHAFDLFSIIGLLTETELKESIEFGTTHAQEPIIQAAKQIVQDCFDGMTRNGMVAIRIHNLYQGVAENGSDEFVRVLKDIFGM
ncbi:MAG: hypothetical protein ACRC10_12010 [Thermoguttaceae bacterium]